VAVTGGLGFIGSAVIRQLLRSSEHVVLNIDCATYAATHQSVASVADDPRYRHTPTDITDRTQLRNELTRFRPDAIVHLAAETHVDRSIDGPGAFVDTNIVGTYELLEAARSLDAAGTKLARFVHVSTDEVFGSLGPSDPPFGLETPYAPRSPYAASKAAADHLVRAWHETYGLPTIITNCSNNYGPFQFPEKLVPLMTIKAVGGEPLPVYGRGDNVRDWLHVEDHAAGILAVLERGAPGETYLFGGGQEVSNLDLVRALCDIIDAETDRSVPAQSLITLVPDRPGHDFRYAIDARATTERLGWAPRHRLGDGLAATVRWYLTNGWWWRPLLEGRYDGSRLGQSDRPGAPAPARVDRTDQQRHSAGRPAAHAASPSEAT
jgi:dTDP-glucose 4,6-dehydratase